MPKEPSSRKFLKSVRQSASPLASNGNGTVHSSALSIADQAKFADMKSGDLVKVILERLRHPLPSERCIGADMVSTFLTTKRLTQMKPAEIKEITGALGTLLLDRAENVRFGAIDALCYISSVSDEICDMLVQSNIHQPIMAMLEAHFLPIVDWTNPKVTDKKLTLNVNVDCFNLLTNLCGVSSHFVDLLLSHSQFVSVLKNAFQTTSPCEGGISFIGIAIAAAQCLTVICEDAGTYEKLFIGGESTNQILSASVLADIVLKPTLSSEQAIMAAHECLVSLIISLVCSYHFKLAAPSGSEGSAQMQWSLEMLQKQMLEIKSQERRDALHQQIGQIQEQIRQDKASEKGNLCQMTSLYETIKYRYLTKRNYFELLTNMLAPNGDDDDDEEESEDVPDDDVDDEMEAMDSSELQTDSANASGSVQLLHRCCREDSLLLKCLLAELASTGSLLEKENDRQLLEKHVYGREIISLVQTLMLSALTLAHNLISSRLVTKEEPLLGQLWNSVYLLAFKPKTEDLEVREEAIHVVREFITTFSDMNLLNVDDLEALVSFLAESSTSHLTKVNIVRIWAAVAAGAVSRHCASPTNPIEPSVVQILERVSTLLVAGVRTPNADLVLRAEILDALMDIFADDNELTTELCRKLSLLDTLRTIAGEFRREMKANPRIVKQNAVVSTVGLNLNRFIKYKQKVVR